jgi:hypothetical protein
MEALIALCPLVIMFAVVGVMLAGMWKVFTKAGQPGWACIVPFYNNYVLTCEIAKKEILWFILMFIPIVGIVAMVMVCMEVAKKFGKSEAYGIGLALLGPIFFPMLGFSDARYQGGRSLDDDDDDEYEPRPKKRQRDDDEEDAPPPKKKPRRDDD